MYAELQQKVQMNSPFSIMFQHSEQSVLRKNVKGYVSGSNFDLVFYRNITK
jgi:peptide/nickel transport system substrate-binding protein